MLSTGFLMYRRSQKMQNRKKNMFLELVPECDRRNSSFQEMIFREIHWTNAVMPIFVASRGRPASRETMSDAHSRKTTVSFRPLQPIFQLGVFDELLEQRKRRAELWKHSKKDHLLLHVPTNEDSPVSWR